MWIYYMPGYQKMLLAIHCVVHSFSGERYWYRLIEKMSEIASRIDRQEIGKSEFIR